MNSKKSTLMNLIGAATISGLLAGMGDMGAQSRIVGRHGSGIVRDRKNNRVVSKVNGVNKVSVKVGEYGGAEGKAKKFAAGLKRDRKRLSRIEWCGGMSCRGSLRFSSLLGGFVHPSLLVALRKYMYLTGDI